LWRLSQGAVGWPSPLHVVASRPRATRSYATRMRTSSLQASPRVSAPASGQNGSGASGSGSRAPRGAAPGGEGQVGEAGRLRCGAMHPLSSLASLASPPGIRRVSSSGTSNWIGHWASLSSRSRINWWLYWRTRSPRGFGSSRRCRPFSKKGASRLSSTIASLPRQHGNRQSCGYGMLLWQCRLAFAAILSKAAAPLPASRI